jgi:predicted PurR-regulated permease PerM
VNEQLAGHGSALVTKKSLLPNKKEVLGSANEAWEVVKTAFSKVSYFLFASLMLFVYWFIFLVKYDRILQFFDGYIPRSKKPRTHEILGEIDKTVSAFLKGRLLICLISGAIYSIGWWLADVPFWLLLGMFSGFLCIIPFASAVGWPLAVLLKYYDTLKGGGSFSFMAVLFWPSFVYGFGQFFEGWVLSPAIQGRRLDLHAGTIILAVFVGGALGGILGIFLAIPFTAAGKIVLKELVLPPISEWAKRH